MLGFQKLLGFFRNKIFSFLKQSIQLANPEINRLLENNFFQTFLESNQITAPCANSYATTPSTTTTISDFVGK